MRQKSGPVRAPGEQVVKDIRRATRRHFSAEEKIRVRAEAPFISAIESPVGSHDRNRGAAEDIALRAADRVVRSSG